MHLSSMHAPLRSIHRELMILLKKEKNAKELISEELKESFELGSDVKERNQQLQQSNHSLQQQLETYRRQLKSLELKLNYYGSWVRQTEETEVKFE
jgi:septation ring formation regulator EzrA